MTEVIGDGKALIEQIAKALVDDPAQVAVDQVEEDGESALELTVALNDLGRVIGKQGRTARAMRNLLGAAGLKFNKRFALEIPNSRRVHHAGARSQDPGRRGEVATNCTATSRTAFNQACGCGPCPRMETDLGAS
jgi:predicted RNA-binding protein YlqC (UPF0109 family)